jgi:hypothetical protein
MTAESANPERRDRKKLKKLNLKKDKTKEDLSKIKILEAKLNVYNVRKKSYTKKQSSQQSEDDILNEAFKENHKYWDNLAKEKKRQQEEEKKRQEEEEKRKQQEEEKRKQEEQRKEEQRKQEAKEKELPAEIINFLQKPFDKKIYRTLQKQYHPDKHKYSQEICNRYTQAINAHKSLY